MQHCWLSLWRQSRIVLSVEYFMTYLRLSVIKKSLLISWGAAMCSPDVQSCTQEEMVVQVETGWQLQCITTQLGAHSTSLLVLSTFLTCFMLCWVVISLRQIIDLRLGTLVRVWDDLELLSVKGYIISKFNHHGKKCFCEEYLLITTLKVKVLDELFVSTQKASLYNLKITCLIF